VIETGLFDNNWGQKKMGSEVKNPQIEEHQGELNQD
jgi:hypothetical protein